MKKLILGLSVISLGLFSCTKDECKKCTTSMVVTMGGVVQEDSPLNMNLNTSPIEYCGDQLKTIENNPETKITTQILDDEGMFIEQAIITTYECN